MRTIRVSKNAQTHYISVMLHHPNSRHIDHCTVTLTLTVTLTARLELKEHTHISDTPFLSDKQLRMQLQPNLTSHQKHACKHAQQNLHEHESY